MSDQINIAEAKAHFSRIIDRVERGESVTISRNNRPIARLTPIRPDSETVVATFARLRSRVEGPVLRDGETWRQLAHEGHDR